MTEAIHLDKFIPRSRRAFAWGIAIALGVLAVTIVSGLFFVRDLVREQMIRRDAEALHATTLMEQLDLAPDGEDIRTDMQIGFDSAVRASRLRGVMGIRFFDKQGDFSDTFPATIMPQALEEEAFDSIWELEPHGRFLPHSPMDSVFIYLPSFSTGRISSVPVLQVTIPLHQRDTEKLAGAAQFIIEGQSMAEEFARLDSRLVQIGATTFAMAGVLLVAMLWPAFRRVQKLNWQLARHGERLQRANDELALTARISAVGAISAHLMHGLKNPLASLSHFVSRNDLGSTEADLQDWEDALTASRRMQSMVEHTLEVLCDARGEATYELTVTELGDDVQKRVAATASQRNVMVAFQAEGNCTLSSRTANLASLILVNLLENAIEATPPGGGVSLSVSRRDDILCFRVRDGGTGFPDHQLDHLFLPGKSTREGGSGIGLAISKQIADYLEASLELEESTPAGCVFLLELPMDVCLDPPD
ncbi:Sporulation kinase E [Pontiella desulfatans]|uniref:histidine kinase n=1 Tax=Pontiella desulfatans TaxID=2750659 RepID=A0A6C2UBN4_PONDE|nr:HAMP domain-containing sensor histidine kinase [Pontiella desulfatans]VGO17283.1 Sporulation kinase E [Pontiella desulfatans]